MLRRRMPFRRSLSRPRKLAARLFRAIGSVRGGRCRAAMLEANLTGDLRHLRRVRVLFPADSGTRPGTFHIPQTGLVRLWSRMEQEFCRGTDLGDRNALRGDRPSQQPLTGSQRRLNTPGSPGPAQEVKALTGRVERIDRPVTSNRRIEGCAESEMPQTTLQWSSWKAYSPPQRG